MSKPPRKPGRSGGGAKDSRGGRDRPRSGDRPQKRERSFGDRSERPAGQRSESKFAPRSERPFVARGERTFGDRPQGARPAGPRPDRRPDSPGRPPRDEQRRDAPRSDFSRGDRDRFGKPPRAGGRDDRAPRDAGPARSERPYQGKRPERSEHPYRGDRPQRTERPQGEERPRKFERPQRSDRPAHAGRPERSARPARSERPQRQNTERGPRADVAVESWGGKRDFRSDERGNRPAFKPRKPFGKNWRKPVRDPDGPVLLYGWHSVKAALENPARKFHKLLVTENALHRLQDDGIDLPIDPDLVEASVIDAELGPDAVHQGILAEADPLPALDISEVAGDGIILVMDQITDPHNVGAILRTAVAFGVTAIITTQRHSPDMTGVLAKAASGALEYVPMITVTNLARALEALKKNNVFVVGLDSEGDGDIASVPLRAPLALVVGAEGKGLRQLTRATCDQVARLELPGKIKSLNVSNATALALYVAASRVAPG